MARNPKAPKGEAAPTGETAAPDGVKPSTTAMAPRPAQSLTRNDFRGLGETAIGADDIQMPRLKLLQALSEPVVNQEAPPGNFWNSLTGENYGPLVKVVPVVGFKNRVYLEPGKGLLCRSLDMVTGVGTPGGACESCPLKDWPEDRGKGGPKCRESRNWVALIVGAAGDEPHRKGDGSVPEIKPLDEPQFVVLQFTSMASGAAQRLNGLYMSSRLSNPAAQWSDYAFLLAAASTRNDKGSFFVPDVRPAGRTDDAQKQAAQSLLGFISGRTLIVDVDADDDTPGPVTPAPGQPSF